MADATDLKSVGQYCPCGFESHLRYIERDTKDMKERYDLIFNTTIKVLAIIVLIIAGVTLLNLNGIASNGRDVSNTAKDDGKLILKEVTESAVSALRERREKREE